MKKERKEKKERGRVSEWVGEKTRATLIRVTYQLNEGFARALNWLEM